MITRLRASVFLLFLLCSASETRCDESSPAHRELCIVRDPQILESSGIAICRTVKNAVWMHNDSGDVPRLFLVGFDGATKAIVNVDGVKAMDWEDMCSFEMNGESWLLIGDIGDNARQRGAKNPPCQLLLIKEPRLRHEPDSSTAKEISVEVDRTIEFQFPDGPHDCESLAVDTGSRTILMVTKSSPLNCAMYSLPLRLDAGHEKVEAKRLAPVSAAFATAMDISPDGKQLAIVNMFNGVMLTRNDPTKDSWNDPSAVITTPLTLPNRKQGESVCFTGNGNSLLLNSEGTSQPLWELPCKTRAMTEVEPTVGQ